MKRLTALLILALAATFVVAQNQTYPPPSPDNSWTYGQNSDWDQSWNHRPDPRSGACFYTDRDFNGNHFCVRTGDRLPSLPGHFGDHISSIQLFGGATAQVFNDRDFKNGTIEITESVNDLRNADFRKGHTWNNRISSIIVH